MNVLTNWLRRYFSDPQIVILLVFIFMGVAVIVWVGQILAPVLASIVIAYLLEAGVRLLSRWGVPRLAAVVILFVIFMCALIGALFGLVPVLSHQATQFFQGLPDMLAHFQAFISHLPERYPDLITPMQAQAINDNIQNELTSMGKAVLSHSLASLISAITFLIYLILMPLLVFFFLKDKDEILAWLASYLPRNRDLVTAVWEDVNAQIANFIRGKVWEILIVWAAAWILFSIMGLNFSVLLSLLVGLSVVVPYVGAIAVSIPVVAVAYFQFGLSVHFWWLIAFYSAIHIIDGNVLIPILYSEVVNVHPVAIMIAVLFFGGIWGFWGVFFAIPLATLVHAIIRIWVRRTRDRQLELPPTTPAE
ncbi:MAG TPA: AI-2E family transporter [Gammaproteobacteria bacterium]|nr:AI-2E family transporter [Gammaproteobacteria bacterium]